MNAAAVRPRALPTQSRGSAHPPARPIGSGRPATDGSGRPTCSGHTGRTGLDRLNTATDAAAEALLLACCGSHRWARRLAAHRPYPDLDALLAAADEASYDLTTGDLAEALARESAAHHAVIGSHGPGTLAARTALRAAHAAYEHRFGHVFVICLDGLRPQDALDHVLAGIHARLGNEPDEERTVAADELRRIARGRLARLATGRPVPR